jgi:IMP dehydrogenase
MIHTALTFDDVLLVPAFSTITSRSEVKLDNSLDKERTLTLPVISSPMDTVTEVDMAVTISKHGGLGIVHRYNSAEHQAKLVWEAKNKGAKLIGAAVGSTGDFYERTCELVKCGVDIICVDVAHGHHQNVKEAMEKIKNHPSHYKFHLMAGNVATGKAFQDLSDWGADSIRVGIGGGSICSTRLQTGFGVPNLAAIFDCVQSQAYRSGKTKLIVDGGIKNSGDMVKAFAAGAHFVMCGSILAGTDESPGETFVDGNGVKMKNYRGMASREAQTNWRGKSSAPEGISTFIKHKGSVENILDDIRGNIQSGFSYAGARNFTELSGKVQFIQQTSAGLGESFTHILNKK